MRFILALKCFFLVLFAKRLPPEAAALLPPESKPEPGRLPVREAELVPPALSTTGQLATTQPMEAETVAPAPVVKQKGDDGVRGAVQLLAILQREGRLLDFLQEEIDAYTDAQIGAAVRDIHRGCKKALAEHVPLEPVLTQPENATVRVDEGFDPNRIRLTGNVMGEPPYTGTLRHHGWRCKGVTLPTTTVAADPTVVAPAEVELP
jgi:hypothetical protein